MKSYSTTTFARPKQHHKNAFFAILLLSLPLLSLSQYPQSPPPPSPTNPRLEKAYIALQAWKHAITDDPTNFTSNWCGPLVCDYKGVYCSPAPDDKCQLTVAGVDLNHARLAGTIPEEIGLLSDLALLHLNSNRFTGTLPQSVRSLSLLYELDVSNNQFSGGFPEQVLCLPNLKYLDIRFNMFCGNVPAEIFDKKLDALFVNNNHFEFEIPDNFGNSTASVIVIANNKINGCLPKTFTNMAKTLNQLLIINSGLTSCIPPDIGELDQLVVLDLSFNKLAGPLPESIGWMRQLEQLDVAHNMLAGDIPEVVCELPNLKNFTYSYNFFCGEPGKCFDVPHVDDRKNCIAGRANQRREEQCMKFLHRPPVHCDADGCIVTSPPPPPPVY